MIIIILLLILLTLLFGAGPVRSGISTAAIIVVGGLLLLMVGVGAGSWFGETGATVGFWFAVAAIALFVMSKAPRQR